MIHWKSPWCWERLRVEGKEGIRGWDGWMESPIQWTWTWADSRRWWGIGRPGILQSMGSQRDRDDWATEQQPLGIVQMVALWAKHKSSDTRTHANVTLTITIHQKGKGTISWAPVMHQINGTTHLLQHTHTQSYNNPVRCVTCLIPEIRKLRLQAMKKWLTTSQLAYGWESSHIWAGLKSNEPSCSRYSTSSKVKFKYNKVPNCKLGFGTSVLPWAFLSFHKIFLNIHYVLHTPFLSLSSLPGKCAFAHFMVHYFALLICIKSTPLSLEAAWQTCRILRLALWALLGPVTLDLPVWQALLDNSKSLGRVL